MYTATSHGVAVAELADGTSWTAVDVEAQGRTEVTLRTITVAPGGSTGWHYHPGPVICVVRSGTLTRGFRDGRTETVRAGRAFVEEAGEDNVHVGRNLGTEPVVLCVTYLIPVGRPTAVAVAGPDGGR